MGIREILNIIWGGRCNRNLLQLFLSHKTLHVRASHSRKHGPIDILWHIWLTLSMWIRIRILTCTIADKWRLSRWNNFSFSPGKCLPQVMTNSLSNELSKIEIEEIFSSESSWELNSLRNGIRKTIVSCSFFVDDICLWAVVAIERRHM